MAVDTSNATATAGDVPLRTRVVGAIKQAANATGASFEYLLATAKMESDFNPTVGASTSSAHGLFQFIDQTWLGIVKEAGAQLGFAAYADAISKFPSGGYSVSDPSARTAIMKLRDDPVASSAMAGVLTQSNSFELTGKIGRRPSDSELYMAHFMGVGGAARLISSIEDTPQASGAALFPNAAAANRSIFFDHAGRARSVSEVYSVLNARYAEAVGAPATRTALAAFGGTPSTTTAGASAQIVKPAFLSSFPDVGSATEVSTSTSTSTTANSAAPADPMFRSLFQAGDRAHPVSPMVRELWGSAASLTSAAPAAATGSAAPAPATGGGAAQPLDLFSDRNGKFSS